MLALLSGCAAAGSELDVEPLAAPVALSAPMPPACLPRADLLAHLAKKYSEAPVAAGMTNDGRGLVEVLTTGDGGTWTIIVTTPHGMSCLVTAGEGWRWLNPPGPHLGPRT